MCNYKIHLVVMHSKVPASFFHFFFRRQFLFPPTYMVNPIGKKTFVKFCTLSFEVRVIWFKNPPTNIMARSTAKRKKACITNVKNLSTHKMNH